MTCGVYEIVNTVNGKRYVGSSVDIKRRWANHRSHLKNGKHHSPHLQRAWEKYGPNCFSWNILSECGVDEIISKEQLEINISSEYNVAPVAGRNSGYKWTEEQREAHSKSKRKFYSMPENKAQLDKNRSRHGCDEIRLLISMRTKEKLASKSVRDKMSKAAANNWDEERRLSASESAKLRISRASHKAALSEANAGTGNCNYNHTIYNFTHDIHGNTSCTQWELRKKYNLRHSNLSQVCSGIKKSHMGWKISKAPS